MLLLNPPKAMMEEEVSSEESDGEDKPMEDDGSAPNAN